VIANSSPSRHPFGSSTSVISRAPEEMALSPDANRLMVIGNFRKIATYYILLTWVYDAFNELPYLRLRGDFGSGKTRALIVIGSLCYKSFFASGASTVSVHIP
jgi:hypothetical protein